jgi:hypothetical protein
MNENPRRMIFPKKATECFCESLPFHPQMWIPNSLFSVFPNFPFFLVVCENEGGNMFV